MKFTWLGLTDINVPALNLAYCETSLEVHKLLVKLGLGTNVLLT